MKQQSVKILYEAIKIAGDAVTKKKTFTPVEEESKLKATIRHLELLFNCHPNTFDAYEGEITGLKCIQQFTRDVHDVLIGFIVLEAYNEYVKARDAAENSDKEDILESFKTIKKIGTDSANFSWMPLCAYLSCGVRGLLVTPRGKNKYSIGNAFAIVHISAYIQNLEATPPPIEPIWKRTNNYILELITTVTGYGTDLGYKTVQPCKIQLSKCLASDYGHYWHHLFPDEPNPLIPKGHKAVGPIFNSIVMADGDVMSED